MWSKVGLINKNLETIKSFEKFSVLSLIETWVDETIGVKSKQNCRATLYERAETQKESTKNTEQKKG